MSGDVAQLEQLAARPNTGPQVVVIGHDRVENTGLIYAALERAGCRVKGTTERVDGLDLAHLKPDVVVVRGDMVPRDQDEALLEALQPDAVYPWKLVVLLGRNRSDRVDALRARPHVEGVMVVPPYDFAFLNPATDQAVPAAGPVSPAAHLPRSDTNPATPAVSVNPALSLTPVKRRMRLALYGARGGVGVSTAALKVAQWWAEADSRVILIDATGRGDLHLLLNLTPTHTPHTQGNLTLWLGPPSEAVVAGYDAIVIDGGRTAGTFNARWVEIGRVLKDDELRAVAGLPVSSQASRALGLGKLFSVRITE